ncbi:MAG: hypothetical protein ACHREM_28580 [Polyangiales bacterium]
MNVRTATLVAIIGVALHGVLVVYEISTRWMRSSVLTPTQSVVATFFDRFGDQVTQEFFLVAGLLTFLVVLFIKQGEKST